MTYRLIKALRQFYRLHEHVTKKAQAENDMTKTLVVVVLMFMSCQLLNPIRRIIRAALPASSRRCGSFYFYFSYLTSVALAVEVSSHFFIYSVCNNRFGEKLSQKWRRLVARSTVVPSAHVIPAPENNNRPPI